MPHSLQWTRCHVSLPFCSTGIFFFLLPNVNTMQNKGKSGLGPPMPATGPLLLLKWPYKWPTLSLFTVPLLPKFPWPSSCPLPGPSPILTARLRWALWDFGIFPSKLEACLIHYYSKLLILFLRPFFFSPTYWISMENDDTKKYRLKHKIWCPTPILRKPGTTYQAKPSSLLS